MSKSEVEARALTRGPTSAAEVGGLVELALQRIEDDAPDYGEPLLALADSRAALAWLATMPELARPLFVELRKLRPLTLWVRDRVEQALISKREAVLDGAVCSLAAGGTSLRSLAEPRVSTLVADGRECWLEVDASVAEGTLRALPAGWGLIITGDLTSVSFAALRRQSPLRALGAALDVAGANRPDLAAGTRLDLVIVSAPEPPEEALGARVLWSVNSAEQLQLAPETAPSIGVLCDAKAAFSCALRLATMRQPGSAPR